MYVLGVGVAGGMMLGSLLAGCEESPGELLFCQGTAPVSIMAARSIPPKVKISLGSGNLLRSIPTTKITNNSPPPSPSIR